MNTEHIQRRTLVSRLMEHAGRSLVVCGLGSPTYDVAAADDRPRNFYLWGAMGGAAMTGLGLALSKPKERVVVVTGDGEALMGAGGFAVIAAQSPSNLAVLVLDNQSFGETGGQDGLSAFGTDIAGMAEAAGIPRVLRRSRVRHQDELIDATLNWPGPVVAVATVQRRDEPRVVPLMDGVQQQREFREELER